MARLFGIVWDHRHTTEPAIPTPRKPRLSGVRSVRQCLAGLGFAHMPHCSLYSRWFRHAAAPDGRLVESVYEDPIGCRSMRSYILVLAVAGLLVASPVLVFAGGPGTGSSTTPGVTVFYYNPADYASTGLGATELFQVGPLCKDFSVAGIATLTACLSVDTDKPEAKGNIKVKVGPIEANPVDFTLNAQNPCVNVKPVDNPLYNAGVSLCADFNGKCVKAEASACILLFGHRCASADTGRALCWG